MKKKATQWRRLYTFECKGCGRPKAQTVKYRVLVERNCKLCRKAYIDSRQLSLLGTPVADLTETILKEPTTQPRVKPGEVVARDGSVVTL